MGKGIRLAVWATLIIAGIFVFWQPVMRLMYPFPYSGIVEHAASVYEVDPLLLAAIMRTESHFNPDAVSPRGARGLMQIMPDTASWAAEQIPLPGFELEELNDPTVNITIAAWYIRFLFNYFQQPTVVSLAAYNAGPGTVKGWLEDAVWSGSLADVETIPYRETRQYVERVVQAYKLYRRIYSSAHPGYNDLFQ